MKPPTLSGEIGKAAAVLVVTLLVAFLPQLAEYREMLIAAIATLLSAVMLYYGRKNVASSIVAGEAQKVINNTIEAAKLEMPKIPEDSQFGPVSLSSLREVTSALVNKTPFK